MKVLLSHPRPVRRSRIAAALGMVLPEAQIIQAQDLSETFDSAEHLQPNAVVIAEEFCSREEFEFLKALFEALHVFIIVLSEGGERSFAQINDLHVIPDDGDLDTLVQLLKTRPSSQKQSSARPARPQSVSGSDFDPNRVILLGASTGGVDALITVLHDFPANAPPTLIVQHTGSGFSESLSRLLNRSYAGTVELVRQPVALAAGHVYLTPDNDHHLALTHGPSPRATLTDAAPHSGHRPSVDVLFKSAVRFATDVTAVIFTGMGRDGAEGLLELRKAGATTIGQDEATSVVYGMPRVAAELGAVGTQYPLPKIAAAVLESCRARPSIRKFG